MIPPAGAPIDESPIGAWLGVAYVVLCLTLWYPIDRWLHRHGHEYITTEFREVLNSGGWRAVVMVGLIGGALMIALYHFFWQRNI